MDVGEEEGVTGDAHAGGAAVLALDDMAEFVDGYLASAYIEEGADDGADHVAEEAVGLNGEAAVLVPVGLHDAAVVGLGVGMEFGE